MAAKHPLEGSLSADLGALLESGEAADVTLEVSGSRMSAHGPILAARSALLRTKLLDLAEKGSSLTVHISDMEEDVVRQLLRFMYTDQVPNLGPYAARLLAAADEYGIPLLKQLCEDTLAPGITVANASEMAVLAVNYSCSKLKEVSIEFIRTHNEVLATRAWEDAILNHPRTVAEICRLMVAQPSEKSTGQQAHPQSGQLEEDMTALLESGAAVAATDVMLKVGRCRQWMPAHRAVLVARCPALATNLCVPHVEPDVLAPVLRFLYTGRVVLQLDLAGEVLAAAVKLSLPRLTEQCEQLLMERLTVETAAAVAVTAVTRFRPALRSAAVELIRQRASQVMGTEGWKATMREHTEVAVEICRLVAAADAAADTAAVATAAASVPVPAPPAGSVPAAAAAAAAVAVARAAPPAAAWDDKAAVPKIRRTSSGDMNRRLLQAAKDGAVGELRELLAMGADVGMRDGYKMTALHWAAERGHIWAVQCLLNSGADVNARDRWRRTPLHRTVARGHDRVARALLESGAEESPRDIMGRTPASLAKLKNIWEI